MKPQEVSDHHYTAFTAYLQRHTGIVLGESKRYLVKSRLNSLLLKTGADDINALIDSVVSQRDRQMSQLAIDAMTTNETLWFRDNYPFDLLKSEIFPQLAKRKSTVNVWSAACSSGQEPFSIGMIYKEYCSNQSARQFRLSITATDLSTEMIEKCNGATFDELSLSRGGLTPERRRRFFTESGSGRLKVGNEVTSLIRFRQHNLLGGGLTGQSFDIIFCRNVLIYFSAEVKTKLLQQFAASLSPGGILFLGASESIMGASQLFTMVKCSPGLYYKLK